MGLIEPAPEGPESRRVGRLIRAVLGDRRRAILVTLGTGLVFFAHFRPWQGGLVEEWGLALAWERYGLAAYTQPASLDVTLARPLLLFPVYLALEISRGSFVGLYAALALVGIAQLALANWALSAMGTARGVRWALALAVALHPWWIAGYAVRFLSAQIAIALCILWFGSLVRYLRGGGRWWLLAGSAALLTACLTYPAPALAIFFGLGAVIVGTRVGLRRAVVASSATLATIGLYGVWALVVAPRLATTYESGIIAGNDTPPGQAVKAVVRTLALDAPGPFVFLIVSAVVVLSLGFSQVLTPGRAWIALGLAMSSVGAALIYYPSRFHLSSGEHISLAVGLAAWFVVCGVSAGIGRSPRLAVLLQGVTVIAVLVGAVAGYTTLGRYAAGQQSMLALAAEMREHVAPGERLVVADSSGYYGSLYLFIPPYLDVALQASPGAGPETVLCTQPDVVRQPGVATPDCTTLLDSGEAEWIGEGETAFGEVGFYSVPVEGE
jgi:hypothetical protein